jgi:hypothetical protein
MQALIQKSQKLVMIPKTPGLIDYPITIGYLISIALASHSEMSASMIEFLLNLGDADVEATEDEIDMFDDLLDDMEKTL